MITIGKSKKRRTYNYNFKYLVIKGMRDAFHRSPEVKRAYDRAYCHTKKGPRGGALYKCEICGSLFRRDQMECHHIEEVIPLGMSYEDMTYDELEKRINVEAELLQVLCKPCHLKLTNKYKAEAARIRREKKFEFDPTMYYILESGIIRHGVGVDCLRDEEIKYIAKSYKTMKGAAKYLDSLDL